MRDSDHAPIGSRYVDQRHYIVADLDDLTGPVAGQACLDRALDWSADPTYDVDDPGDRQAMYQTVLNEATDSGQLRRWLDRDTLIGLWPELWLPVRLRQAWESRHPALAARSTARSRGRDHVLSKRGDRG